MDKKNITCTTNNNYFVREYSNCSNLSLLFFCKKFLRQLDHEKRSFYESLANSN